MSKVITIGDFSVAKKNSRYNHTEKACRHIHVELDENGEIVECMDCGKQVTPWFALKMLVSYFEQEHGKIESAKAALAIEREKQIHLTAARKVEAVWRAGHAAACPHCHAPISAASGLGNSIIRKPANVEKIKGGA